jgi:hypothetical protein
MIWGADKSYYFTDAIEADDKFKKSVKVRRGENDTLSTSIEHILRSIATGRKTTVMKGLDRDELYYKSAIKENINALFYL